MKIKLKRSGGFTGILMISEDTMSLTPEQIESLQNATINKRKPVADGFTHTISIDDEEFRIDPKLLDSRGKEIFNKLKLKLKASK